MKKDFEVRFEYPAEQDSFYDPTTRETFFFGQNHDAQSLVKSLNHEAIHFLVHVIAGKRVSFKFDKICDAVEKWDKRVYSLLY